MKRAPQDVGTARAKGRSWQRGFRRLLGAEGAPARGYLAGATRTRRRERGEGLRRRRGAGPARGGGGRGGGAPGGPGLAGAWAADPAPPRPAQARGGAAGSHGNRGQQVQPRGVPGPRAPRAGMSASEVDRHVAQRYLLQRRLGKGAYGIVWKAVDRRTGEVVAIKKIFDAFRDKTDAQSSTPATPWSGGYVGDQHQLLWISSMSASFLLLTHTRVSVSFQRTFREIMLLQEFGDHPNIIRLLDVIRAENDRDIYLVLESMDTDLNAVICKGGLLKDIHKRYIFYQLLRATKFIHSGHVIHRDQKPSNVLLDSSCLVKLCDFGLARSLSGLPEGPEGQALTEYVATRWYRAPEVLLSASRYTPGVDMWSLGCILGEMLRGKPLFPGTSTLHQLELILETIPPPSKEDIWGWSPASPPKPAEKSLHGREGRLQSSLSPHPPALLITSPSGAHSADLLALGSSYSASVLTRLGSRPRQTLDTLLPPDTPPEALDLLRRLLVFAPDKRLSAAQALRHPYVQRFHCPAREWTLEADVRLPVQEGVQLSAPEYRNFLYQVLWPATPIIPHPRASSRPPPASAIPNDPHAQPRPSPPADDPGSQGQQPGPERGGPGGRPPAPGTPAQTRSRPPAGLGLARAEPWTQASEWPRLRARARSPRQSHEPSQAELRAPAPASAPRRSWEGGKVPRGDDGVPLGTLVVTL
ncbi:mitogen-activated protein kinase 15 isoform X8 [Equus asinus]|uniref:mitogen-activated protein kinase 15 isoform X8 n=1 Tax=Equus asinus TaxID=9793 RepID=UPI0038F6DC4E